MLNSLRKQIETQRVPKKTITHKFDYYPPCIIQVISTDIGSPAPCTYEDLEVFRKLWFDCIKPLLKHLEEPELVEILLRNFTGSPPRLPLTPGQTASDYMWDFIKQIAYCFPRIIFEQLGKTIADTHRSDPLLKLRVRWIRKQLLKDLRKSESRLREMRQGVINEIIAGDRNEQDQRLLVLEHVLGCVLQEVHGKSLRSLIGSLVNV